MKKNYIKIKSKKLKIFISIISYLAALIFGAIAEIPVEKLVLHRERINLWTVSGCLKLKDKDSFDTKDTLLSIKPPDQDLYLDGQFVIHKVPIKLGGEGKPSLLIKKDGYKIIEIVLEEKPPKYYEEFGLQNYLVKYQKKNKNMEIKKLIILEREDMPR